MEAIRLSAWEPPQLLGIEWRTAHWTEWEKNGFGSSEEYIEWLKEQSGKQIRADIDGCFIDFPNMETRYKMLDAYLNATSVTDSIKVQ